MLVVSDTSPITNLIQIDLLPILKDIYGEIIIPESVYQELCEIENQQAVIDQMSWIQVITPHDFNLIKQLKQELDQGESESLALAIELNADFVIIDELKGRQKAQAMGIKVIGLLGTLLKAKQLGFIPFIKPVINQLIEEAGFHINPQLKAHILNLASE